MRNLTVDEYVAVFGGACGPVGFLDSLIPDRVAGVDFTAACQRHDRFYDSPGGLSRSEIDKMFLNDMLNAAGGNVAAQAAAYGYYSAVSLFGGLYFNGGGSSGSFNGSHSDVYLFMEQNANWTSGAERIASMMNECSVEREFNKFMEMKMELLKEQWTTS
jgi:hypothetical protein